MDRWRQAEQRGMEVVRTYEEKVRGATLLDLSAGRMRESWEWFERHGYTAPPIISADFLSAGDHHHRNHQLFWAIWGMVISMKDDQRQPEEKLPEQKRKPYVPPQIESEETFERAAVLGCGKTSATCPVTAKNS